MKKVLGVIFNLTLFVGASIQGIQALRHHSDAGWVAGFVFCSTGSRIFGKGGYIASLDKKDD